MEITPNYLNNVQNQNAQGANSATAEIVVEENLFDGNEANATQNNAVSQDYQNAEMLNTFVAAFTAVMAPFMQMMTQFMGMMAQQMNPQPTQTPEEAQESITAAIDKNILQEYQDSQNDKALLQEYQETQNDKALLQEYQETRQQEGQALRDKQTAMRQEIEDRLPETKRQIGEVLQSESKLLEWFNRHDKNSDGIIDEKDGLREDDELFGADINKFRTLLQEEYVELDLKGY